LSTHLEPELRPAPFLLPEKRETGYFEISTAYFPRPLHLLNLNDFDTRGTELTVDDFVLLRAFTLNELQQLSASGQAE
jgi:hypothetical protein